MAASHQRVARKIIERQNAPDKKKRLRDFPLNEVAAMLGFGAPNVAKLLKKPNFPQGRKEGTKRVFTFAEVEEVRARLYDLTGDERYAPRRRPEEKLAVVAVANLKGGSGKSHLAVHLGQSLARMGHRVLMIDLDAQGTTTTWYGLHPETDVAAGQTFGSWILADTQRNPQADRLTAARACIQSTHWPNIDLVAGNSELHEAEAAIKIRIEEAAREAKVAERRRLSGATGAGLPPIDMRRLGYLAHDEMREFLEVVAQDYDVAIVDCRPEQNELNDSALRAATGVIVPVQARMEDVAATSSYLASLGRHHASMREIHGGAGWDFVRLVVTRHNPQAGAQDFQRQLLERFNAAILLGHSVLDSSAFGTAGNANETLYEHQPVGDRRAYDRALASIQAVCGAIAQDIYRAWGRSWPDGKKQGLGELAGTEAAA
jgi:chromosome partitioning protein